MKFKTLFFIFNIVLFLSFLTIFLLPAFILDPNFMMEFWKKNWYFALIFMLILGIVNLAFLANWKTLSFLEQEDWPALARYLEGQVFEKKRFSARRVQLLCDSLMLLGDFTMMKRLQDLLAEKKQVLLGKNGVRFAAAHLLSGDYSAMHAISSGYRGSKGADHDWMSFFAGFAHHMEKKYDESAACMVSIVSDAHDPVVVALAGYISGKLLVRMLPSRADELASAGEAAKKRITEKYSREKWNRLLEDEKSGIHVVILSKLTGELEPWLYGENAKE